MRQYVNGYSYPQFKIYSGNTLIETIDLNLTDTSGLVEEYEFYYINHQLIDYTNYKNIQGFHINFNLSYESYSKKSNTLNIKKLLDYFISNDYTIILTPRYDFQLNAWEVVLLNDILEIGLLRNGINAVGNRLINLQFKTKYIQTKIPWYDLDDLSVTLDDFITTG